jgi:putative ABC transport system permease protein
MAAALPLGVAVPLAFRQLARHPGRTALSAGLLAVALATSVAFAHVLSGLRTDLRNWYRRTIVADFLIYGSAPDTSFVLTVALPEGLAEEVGRIDGVASVDRLAFVPGRGGGQAILVLARTFAPGRPLPLDLRDGEETAVSRGLAGGETVLGAALAGRLGLRRGDSFALETAHGPRLLRVAGTAAEYAAGGSALYLEWDGARRLLAVPGPHTLLVSALPGRARPVESALRRFCACRGVLLMSNAELRSLIDGAVARVTAALGALAALVALIASFGVANSLLMNVRDQSREFGLLRALGLTRGQLARVVLAEALFLGAASLVPGAAAGLALTGLIYRLGVTTIPAAGPRASGGLVAACCGLTLAVALLASLPPARRAARLRILRLLADR